MALNSNVPYPPLKTATQTRLVVLAPSQPNEPIRCEHLVIDLDADWELPSPTHPPPPQQHELNQIDAQHNDATYFKFPAPPSLRKRHVRDGGGLHPFQRYTALSYTWGDQNNPKEISLNGQPFYVGHNLYMALRRCQAMSCHLAPGPDTETTPYDRPTGDGQGQVVSTGMPLWIDAICINQADINEREAQVKLMARIYSQADNVHADLEVPYYKDEEMLSKLLRTIREAGVICAESQPSEPSRETETSDFLHEPLGMDAESLGMLSRVSIVQDPVQSRMNCVQLIPPYIPKASVRTLEDCGLPPADDSVWESWRRLIGSAYFERLWIIQEFTLAKSVTVWFGNVGLDPGLVWFCLYYLFEYSRNRSFYLTASDAGGRTTLTSGGGCSPFCRLIEQRALRRLYMLSYPNEHSHLLAKMALSRDAKATDQRDKIYGMLGLASDRDGFLPLISYSKPTRQVFLDFSRRFIENGQGIEMLYQVDSGATEISGLPTWVPDWSRASVESSIYRHQAKDARYAASLLVPPSVHIIEPSSKIAINGARVDTIARLSDPLAYETTNLDQMDFTLFLQTGGQLAKQGHDEVPLYPTGEPYYLALLWTLICDTQKSKTPQQATRLYRSYLSLFGWVSSRIATGADTFDSEWSAHFRDITQEGLPNALGRSWCITENGYYGLVPGRTQVGDRVCLFYGGALPFLLRPCRAGDDTEFRLIGHGYFHGLMHGEAFDLKTLKPQRFTLV